MRGFKENIMNRTDILNIIINRKVVAVIRLNEASHALSVIDAVVQGGITVIEVTLTTPNALDIITELTATTRDILVGAGSVLDASMAERCCKAGAQFLVSPILRFEVLEIAHEANIPACIGGFTPTELYTAQEAGADIVKVFPGETAGMNYFKAVKAPMPHLRLMPTGGVTLTNAGEWLQAGACAVGVGSALLDPKAIAEQRFDVLTDNARTILHSIDASSDASNKHTII